MDQPKLRTSRQSIKNSDILKLKYQSNKHKQSLQSKAAKNDAKVSLQNRQKVKPIMPETSKANVPAKFKKIIKTCKQGQDSHSLESYKSNTLIQEENLAQNFQTLVPYQSTGSIRNQLKSPKINNLMTNKKRIKLGASKTKAKPPKSGVFNTIQNDQIQPISILRSSSTKNGFKNGKKVCNLKVGVEKLNVLLQKSQSAHHIQAIPECFRTVQSTCTKDPNKQLGLYSGQFSTKSSKPKQLLAKNVMRNQIKKPPTNTQGRYTTTRSIAKTHREDNANDFAIISNLMMFECGPTGAPKQKYKNNNNIIGSKMLKVVQQIQKQKLVEANKLRIKPISVSNQQNKIPCSARNQPICPLNDNPLKIKNFNKFLQDQQYKNNTVFLQFDADSKSIKNPPSSSRVSIPSSKQPPLPPTASFKTTESKANTKFGNTNRSQISSQNNRPKSKSKIKIPDWLILDEPTGQKADTVLQSPNSFVVGETGVCISTQIQMNNVSQPQTTRIDYMGQSEIDINLKDSDKKSIHLEEPTVIQYDEPSEITDQIENNKQDIFKSKPLNIPIAAQMIQIQQRFSTYIKSQSMIQAKLIAQIKKLENENAMLKLKYQS